MCVSRSHGVGRCLLHAGDGPAGFYDLKAISSLLRRHWPLRTVYLKYKSGSQERGRLVDGALPEQPVVFRENGVRCGPRAGPPS
jgi:hypothetical protein